MHKLRVVVAVLTCERTNMLRSFFVEFERLSVPEGIRLTLLIVDNDPNGTAGPIVAEFDSRIAEIKYVLEEDRGIPVARNRALRESYKMGCDVLCFIDDDEYPDPSWLFSLINRYRVTNAKLIGGPVRVAPVGNNIGIVKSLINRSLIARSLYKEKRIALAARMGSEITIVTNNWLGDLDWIMKHDLWFDQNKHRYSGGSDTAFFRNALRAGCTVAWSPEAIVYEVVPTSRLSIAYQVRRARDQSMTHFHMKNAELSSTVFLSTVTIALIRIVLGCMLLLVPVYGIASPVVAFRSIGWGMGRLNALKGRRSTHYK